MNHNWVYISLLTFTHLGASSSCGSHMRSTLGASMNSCSLPVQPLDQLHLQLKLAAPNITLSTNQCCQCCQCCLVGNIINECVGIKNLHLHPKLLPTLHCDPLACTLHSWWDNSLQMRRNWSQQPRFVWETGSRWWHQFILSLVVIMQTSQLTRQVQCLWMDMDIGRTQINGCISFGRIHRHTKY